MSDSLIHTLAKDAFPNLLTEIADPPKKLYLKGTFPPDDHKYLCVVGSRRYSRYGKEVCERLIAGLSGYPIVIVSGLALGIDSIAHSAALKANLPTIAVPASGLSEQILYPRSHIGLSREIINNGGTLLSEFEPDFKATLWSFPQRNRIMAGMSHAVLIIEAHERSGTLITARLAMEYNRDVLVAPGPLYTEYARGSNRLLREGAQAITGSEDSLEALKIPVIRKEKILEAELQNLSPAERQIIEVLSEPRSRDELFSLLEMSITQINITLSLMEVKGLIRERLGQIERAVD